MIGILIGIMLAALVYWLVIVLTGSTVLAIVAAILALLAAVGTGGYYGRRGP